MIEPVMMKGVALGPYATRIRTRLVSRHSMSRADELLPRGPTPLCNGSAKWLI